MLMIIATLVFLAAAVLIVALWLNGVYTELKREKTLLKDAQESLVQTIHRCLLDCETDLVLQYSADTTQKKVSEQQMGLKSRLMETLEHQNAKNFSSYVASSKSSLNALLEDLSALSDKNGVAVKQVSTHLSQLEKAFQYYNQSKKRFKKKCNKFPHRLLVGLDII